MEITRLELTNFRNIEQQVIEPCSGMNVIYGQNAQGKTNLIESIWLMTGCRSFRGTKDTDLKAFKSIKTKISLDYYGKDRDQNMTLDLIYGRKFTHNGVPLKPMSKVVGEFLAVVFSPVDIALIKDGPAERRKFLDIAISQQRPGYAELLVKYNHCVSERNAGLKDSLYHPEVLEMLDIWEEKICEYGADIILIRKEYIERLQKAAGEIYFGLSGGKEELTITYKSPTANLKERDRIRNGLWQLLEGSRHMEQRAGVTCFGPHRDDLDIRINALPARTFGSQGQQRSCALALKLGMASLVKEFTGEQPVALLDDVMSELDTSRQDYILNHIKDWQVFITCCDPSSVKNLKYGKAFEVDRGVITEI